MNCPHCDATLSFDEPRMGFTVYACEACDFLAEYDYGTLVYESKPDRPMEPPVRINNTVGPYKKEAES